ncbi:histone-lysine N-methyltransferase SETDB1-A isoform X3 [Alosa pseudoharengus]|uniref:histone-lysine N-methyltransferase SETDB1-A isoform X3 n=1 Tax=Alosa pseudoharengus TaxID=34774 RepID=UPI003F88FF71
MGSAEIILFRMDELQRCVEAAVLENSEVKQRKDHNAQTAKWITQREKTLHRSRFLYESVHGSVLECEAVWKGFYKKMAIEYRDTDSENEDSGHRGQTPVIQIADADMGDCDEENHDDENFMDCDEPDTSPAAVKMEQSMLENGAEAMLESFWSVKNEPQLSKQSMNSANLTPTHTLKASAHRVLSPQAPASAQSTPVPSAAPESPTSPLPASTHGSPSAKTKMEANASFITSKLKDFVRSRSDGPQKPKSNATNHSPSKTSKSSTPSSNHITPTSSPTPATENSAPKTSSKTRFKNTARKQTSIRSFTQVTAKPSVTKPNKSTSENSESGMSSEKHGPGATKQQVLASTAEKVSKSKSDPKNLTAGKTPKTVSATTGSQSASPVSTNPKVNTPSNTLAPNETRNSSISRTHTSSPNTSAAGKPPSSTREAANTGNTASKSLMSSSSTTANQQQNSPNSTQQSNQKRSTYTPKTVRDVWGSDCEDSSEDEATKTVSKSQKSNSQSTAPTKQQQQQQPLQSSAPQTNQQGNPPKPVTLTWARPSAKNALQQPVKELNVDMKVMGRQRTKTWKEGTLAEIRTTDGGLKYKVSFEQKKMLLSGHHVAFHTPPMLAQLKVGARVAARYREGNQSWVMSAVVIELPDRKNRMRFLVFYDDGNVGYVTLPDMHLIYKPLDNVWEDIEDPEVRHVVEEFLQQSHVPTILVLREGEELQVRREGKWQEATIIEVDCSLVKITFKDDQHCEWLYKGSERLIYVYRIRKRTDEEKQKASEGTKSAGRPPIYKPQTTSTAVVSATTTATTVTTSKTVSSHQNSTVVVKRTTATVHDVPPSKMQPPNKMQPKVVLTKISRSDIISLRSSQKRVSRPASEASPSPPSTAAVLLPHRGVKRPLPSSEVDSPIVVSLSRLMYNPHRCCPACLDALRPSQPNPHIGRNPLEIPRLHGFLRITGRRRIDGNVSFHVFYRSPCGRSLSTMKQVQDFLFQTRCDFLLLDMFSLDPFVLVKRALPPRQPEVFYSLPDISKGSETVPIPCINLIDSSRPELIEYIAKRKPGKGVYINTQTDFLVGCDCTDGCLDRSKCSCHQLTIEATALCPGGPVDVNAGYAHKRLLAPLVTGVHECNPLCRCDPRMCCNRVVQHGPQLRLELFKTQHKGWGIRCLDDVGKGTFVCTFAGKIVTDELANAEGKVSGDEYFANLDYIEGVEKMKEGYESSAYCSDGEDASKENTRKSQSNAASNSTADMQVVMDSDDDDDDDSDTDDDEDYDDDDDEDVSSGDHSGSDDSFVADDLEDDITIRRNYITRRNAKILKVSVEMRSPTGSHGSRPGFAVKSTHRKVKPGGETTKPSGQKDSPSQNATRRLFDGEENCYIIDALQQGNLGRYLNHSCDPNLFVQNVFVDTHDLRFPWVAFFTKKRVKAGTELTWDYNYEVGSVEGKVLLCNCGSQRCTGRLL